MTNTASQTLYGLLQISACLVTAPMRFLVEGPAINAQTTTFKRHV